MEKSKYTVKSVKLHEYKNSDDYIILLQAMYTYAKILTNAS